MVHALVMPQEGPKDSHAANSVKAVHLQVCTSVQQLIARSWVLLKPWSWSLINFLSWLGPTKYSSQYTWARVYWCCRGEHFLGGMGRGTMKKFFILLWKNLLIKVWNYGPNLLKLLHFPPKKRHWVMSILEVVIPTILFIAIVFLRAEGRQEMHEN